MKKLKIPQQQRREDDSSPPRRVSIGRIAYTAFLCVMMAMMFCQPAFAATDEMCIRDRIFSLFRSLRI